MAQTDARAGFRLPWSSERSNIEQTETESTPSDVAGGWPETDAASPTDKPTDSADATVADTDWGTSTTAPDAAFGATPSDSAAAPAPRKPSKFLADLTRAMQAAAEQERNETLAAFQAEAKAYVEKIHERSATEATALRRQADDDVAGVREWSKAEIARIREETESKIATRKGRLDLEIEQHTAMIEHEIELVQGRVGGFEGEMARFFERLLAEEDPTHFATMAENLPTPPTFDDMPVLDPVEFAAKIEYEAAIAEPVLDDDATDTTEPSAETEADTPTGETETVVEMGTAEETATDGDAVVGEADPANDPWRDEPAAQADSTDGEWTAEATGEAMQTPEFQLDGEVPEDFEVDREAAFAAIQAAAEAAASAEVATDAAARAEAVADIAIEIVGSHDGDEPGHGPTDFDAAEAEAASSTADDGAEIPEIGDDALAARLAGLVPGKAGKSGATDTKATQVVVVGLVSVASIASFKRHLGRLPGVQSVGVSSGPDGEFLFAVNHGADVSLRDAIPGLPSFQARVTGSSDGVLNVTAHDPESDG
jgi:hypothetical protein